MTYTQAQVRSILDQEATKLGVDPKLAEAIATNESGLNPTAVGDYGTSFGLFQLHQGGELGSLSKTQAFDPVINADTALAEVARVAKAHPGMDPGKVAALAQRPADPVGYAANIDAIYRKLPGAGVGAGVNVAGAASGSSGSNPLSAVGSDFTQGVKTIGGAVPNPIAPLTNLEQNLTSSSFWVRILFIIGGFFIVLISIGHLTGANTAIETSVKGAATP